MQDARQQDESEGRPLDPKRLVVPSRPRSIFPQRYRSNVLPELRRWRTGPCIAFDGLRVAQGRNMANKSKSKEGKMLRPAETQDRQPGLESDMRPQPRSEDERHGGSDKL